MSRHVAVLMGGWSAEREVSLKSGAGVATALEEAGYRVTRVDVPHDLEAFLKLLTPRPDVVFNALHGRGGEDGIVQGVLEFLRLPYTHSGVMASAVAMDKDMTKRLLSTAGVRSPKGIVIERASFKGGHPMAPPYVMKPVDEGSTVGLTFVRAGDPPPGAEIWAAGDRLLVEEYIPGRELTAGVMGDKALAVTEIMWCPPICRPKSPPRCCGWRWWCIKLWAAGAPAAPTSVTTPPSRAPRACISSRSTISRG